MVMNDEHDSDTDHVLRALHAHTNDLLGEWTSLRELKLTLVGHGGLEVNDVQQALHQLRKADRIDVDDGNYRVSDGVERPKYRGER